MDGIAENDFILSTLSALCGGRVYDISLYDDDKPPTGTDGKVLPYIVVQSAAPFASERGRSIAQNEQQQPHIMSSTVTVYAGDVNALKATFKEVMSRLVGVSPSATATPFQSRGGFSYGQKDSGTRPTRFRRGIYLRTTLNVGG